MYAGDLTKPGAADELVQKAIDSFGKIDIIVNNAGYTIDGPVHKMSDEHFQAMLDIHTVVPFRVIRAAAPHLREPAKKEREEGKEVHDATCPVTTSARRLARAPHGFAAALDQHQPKITGGSVTAERISPSAELLVAWLSDRLKVTIHRTNSAGPGITEARIDTSQS